MPAKYDPATEISNQLRLTTEGGAPIDFSGLQSLTMRLQVNAADELEIQLPAQYMDGTWRSDMPIWLAGAGIKVESGFNGKFDHIQTFEIVSTTNDYDDDGGEMMTVRGVSELARAARTKEHRTFKGDDLSVLDQICAIYGWTNGVNPSTLAGTTQRLKENGKSDLELLKRIAREAVLGGPRVTKDRVLVMPEPVVGKLRYSRGVSEHQDARRLHRVQVNREAGSYSTQVVVIAWDPESQEFVEKRFEADEFGGDPKIAYEGRLATKELAHEATTQGLVLAVVDHKGTAKTERVEVLASGRYLNETSAEDLARRWFILRERLSRWADVTVDGSADLLPYEAFELVGNLSAMDRGVWLPNVVQHKVDASGWTCECRAIRVVSEAVIKPV